MDRFRPEVQSLVAALRPSKQRRIAVFDADGTLWSSDAGRAFFSWMIEEGHIPKKTAVQSGSDSAFDRDAKIRLAVTSMSGLSEARVERLAAQFFRENFRQRIFEPMRALIGELERKGVEVYIVSASHPWIIRAGAGHLGLDPSRVIGTGVVVKGGLLTDRLDGPLTIGQGKVEQIRRRVGGAEIVLAAGNSRGDREMLRLAPTSLIINPSRQMAEEAGREGWLIHRF